MRRRGLRVSVRRGPPAYGSGHSTEGKPTPPAPRSGPRPGRRPALREAWGPGAGCGTGRGAVRHKGLSRNDWWTSARRRMRCVPRRRSFRTLDVCGCSDNAARCRSRRRTPARTCGTVPRRRDPGTAGRTGCSGRSGTYRGRPGPGGGLPEELRPPTGARGGRWARHGSSGRAHPPGLRRLGEGAAGRRGPGGASKGRPAGLRPRGSGVRHRLRCLARGRPGAGCGPGASGARRRRGEAPRPSACAHRG